MVHTVDFPAAGAAAASASPKAKRIRIIWYAAKSASSIAEKAP
jgi:hypothetical protein